MKIKLLVFIVIFFFIACSKKNIEPDETEILAVNKELLLNTCGENTFSAITSFGSFCPGQHENGKLYLDKDKNVRFYYVFGVANYSYEQFSVIFTLNTLNLGNNKPTFSEVRAAKLNIITWTSFEISSPGQSTERITPTKINVFLSESTPNYISGYYYIELGKNDNFKGYFNKLKIEKQ